MSAFCFAGCSLFNKGDGDGGGDPDDYEIYLSDESDPLIVRVDQSITVTVVWPTGDAVWESLNPEIATVDGGEITGVAEGNTFIVVTIGNDYYTMRAVAVLPAEEVVDPEPDVPPAPPEEKETVTVTPAAVSIEVGKTATISAVSSKGSTVTYSSLNQTVAAVDAQTGVITALNTGSTSIVARSSTGAAAICAVTVTAKPVPETITLNRSTLLVYAGDEAELIATPSKGSAVSWSSSNTSVATVSGGKINALAEGKTTITASVPEGAKAECAVTVLKKPSGTAPEKTGYTLTFNDEFDGNSLDTTKWGYQTGIRDFYNGVWSEAWFWGNNELQYYTDNQKNVNVSGGTLNITAIKENMDNDRTYSSARILTRDKFSQTYGYFEARMKTPVGPGMWPAFWMLPQPDGSWGSNNGYGGWPHSGEIDIMEAKGRLQNIVDHTLHFSTVEGSHRYIGTSSVVSGTTADWHVYAVDWTPAYIEYYLDGVSVQRYNNVAWSTASSSANSAPFDKPFYMLINLAVGGQYDNYNEPGADFTQATMQVDYVRVYQNNLYA